MEVGGQQTIRVAHVVGVQVAVVVHVPHVRGVATLTILHPYLDVILRQGVLSNQIYYNLFIFAYSITYALPDIRFPFPPEMEVLDGRTMASTTPPLR